jgi:hypothetical protein
MKVRNCSSLINDNIHLIGVKIKEITNKIISISNDIGTNINYSKNKITNNISSLTAALYFDNSTIYNEIAKVYNNIYNNISKLIIFSYPAKKEEIILYEKKTRKAILYIDSDEENLSCEQDLLELYEEIIKKDKNQNKPSISSDNFRWIRYICTNILNYTNSNDVYTIKLIEDKIDKNVENCRKIDNNGGEEEDVIGVLVWRKNDSNCVKTAQNHCNNGMKCLK